MGVVQWTALPLHSYCTGVHFQGRRVTTRKEANALVTGSGLVLSIKEVLRNAVQGTYRRNTDNAEISARLSTARMFRGVPVKRRRQYAILEEIREKELMTYECYDGKTALTA